jgi:hypothetical protein
LESDARWALWENGLANSLWDGGILLFPVLHGFYGVHRADPFRVAYTEIPVVAGPYPAVGFFGVAPQTPWEWLQARYGHWA